MTPSYLIPSLPKPISKTVANISVYFAYGLLFLLFAGLASVVSPELMQPTQTGKFFMFAYAMVCAVILFLIHNLFKNDPTVIRLTIIDILLGLLSLYIIVNRFLFQETWGFSLHYYEFLGLGVLYVLLRQIGKNIYPWLFIAVIVSGVIQAVFGNLQLYGFYPSHHTGFKMTGSFFNPGPYGGFLSVIFPVALGIYLFRRSLFKVQGLKFRVPGLVTRVLYGQSTVNKKFDTYNLIYLSKTLLPLAVVFSILMVLPASQSRAAWLAAGVSVSYLLAIRYQWTGKVAVFVNTSAKKATAVLTFVVLILGIAYGLYTFKPDSANGRILVWKVTANMLMDSPWIGHGFDRFKAEYMDYQAAYFQGDPDNKEAVLADNVYYAFSEPLQLAAENGLVGFVISMALLLSVFTAQTRENKHMLNIAKGGLLSIMVFSMFSYPMHLLPVKLIGVLLIATAATFQERLVWSFRSAARLGSWWFRGLTTGVTMLLMIGTTIGLSDLRQAYEGWAAAYNLYQVGRYSQSIQVYEKAYGKFITEGDFLMNYGKALSMAGDHKRAVEMLRNAEDHLNTTIIQTALGDSYKAQAEYEKAEAAYLWAWYMAPNRFYPKYLLAILYDENDQVEKAVATARELMEKQVKIESMAIEEIRKEMETIINKYSG